MEPGEKDESRIKRMYLDGFSKEGSKITAVSLNIQVFNVSIHEKKILCYIF
jgi:hypothetical protein